MRNNIIYFNRQANRDDNSLHIQDLTLILFFLLKPLTRNEDVNRTKVENKLNIFNI